MNSPEAQAQTQAYPVTRQIHFAGSAIAIQTDGPPGERLLDFLFGHLPRHGPAQPRITYHLLQDQLPGKFSLFIAETCLLRAADPGRIAALLMDRACFNLADSSHDGLLLHAALLSWRGQGLLLPASSGRGKSTLTAWLLQRGYDYLTDELVYIPLEDMQAAALHRPLNIKRAAYPVLESLLGPLAAREDVLPGSASTLIPPQALRPDVLTLPGVPIRRILFPHYQPDVALDLQPQTAAQTGLALMQCLINARNLPEHGFPAITRLARLAPAWRMTYGSFAAIGDVVDGLFLD